MTTTQDSLQSSQWLGTPRKGCRNSPRTAGNNCFAPVRASPRNGREVRKPLSEAEAEHVRSQVWSRTDCVLLKSPRLFPETAGLGAGVKG